MSLDSLGVYIHCGIFPMRLNLLDHRLVSVEVFINLNSYWERSNVFMLASPHVTAKVSLVSYF